MRSHKPTTLTIADVEEATLLGQEMYHEIVRDVEQAYYQPLVDFMQLMQQKGLPNARANRGTTQAPGEVAAEYPGQEGYATRLDEGRAQGI